MTLLLAACAGDQRTDYGEGEWLRGTVDERFEQVEEQFGGFSQAMWEVSYRYVELYWAGQDMNWGYAAYQAEHIREAMEAGLERRPARAASAQAFLNVDLPALEESIAQRDSENFREQFRALTASCNSCHVAEDVGFIQVGVPEARISPAGRAAAAAD